MNNECMQFYTHTTARLDGTVQNSIELHHTINHSAVNIPRFQDQLKHFQLACLLWFSKQPFWAITNISKHPYPAVAYGASTEKDTRERRGKKSERAR